MSFQQGLSGLNSASKTLEVIGNNVANSNTVGFKQSQAQFSDVFANSLAGGGGSQVGIGVKVASIAQQFAQGNLTASNNPLDIAINGGGFFQIQNNDGTRAYSRNGQFHLSDAGEIINGNGAKLMGYAVNEAGVRQTGSIVPLEMSTRDIDPKVSTEVKAELQMDARSTVPAAPFSITDPLSYNNATSVSVFDSQGNPHVLQTFYVKTAPNSWDVYATNDGAAVGFVEGTPYSSGVAPASVTASGVPTAFTDIPAGTFSVNGVSIGRVAAGADALGQAQAVRDAINLVGINNVSVTLDASNRLVIASTASPAVPVTISLNGSAKNGTAAGANAQALADQTGLALGQVGTQAILPPIGRLNFTSGGKIDTTATAMPFLVAMDIANGARDPLPIKLDFTGTTQFGSPFGVNSLEQDGYASGRLAGYSVGDDGVISGRYTNGRSAELGQVILANFRNPNGLKPLGDNLWEGTAESGPATSGAPGTSSLGVLQASAVEDSNVDLTAELVNMITAQRVYQANAQTIKTQDQIMQTLVNMR
jgi:flagellar hook protein FlgE